MRFSTIVFPAAGIRQEDAFEEAANPEVGVALFSADELIGVFLVNYDSLSDGASVDPLPLKAGAAGVAFEGDCGSRALTRPASMVEALAPDAVALASLSATRANWGARTVTVN